MGRYDKYDPKVGGYRAPLAADWLTADVEKVVGVGHNAAGAVVKGAGTSGIKGLLVLTMVRQAGEIVDVMTSGEIVEFGPTSGVPGTDFGTAGTTYYSDSDGNVVAVSGTNEVQTVTVVADGGTYTLNFDGEDTGDIAENAASSAVQTALRALPNLGADDVTVTGNAGGPYTVTFGGSLAGQDVPKLTADSSDLTGADAAVTISTFTAGSASGGVYVGHTVEGQRLIVRVRPGVIVGGADFASIPAGTITGDMIAASAITGVNIAEDAISTVHLEDGSVTVAKIDATGTPGDGVYLEGDGTWSAPA